MWYEFPSGSVIFTLTLNHTFDFIIQLLNYEILIMGYIPHTSYLIIHT